MPRFFRLAVTIVCALLLSGAHWMVLQMTAWTGMLVVRTEQTGVVVAVQTTFSGEKPCQMCKAIMAGQKEEGKKLPESPMFKKLLEVALLAPAASEWPERRVSAEVNWPAFLGESLLRGETPPTPPPLA